jgi:hypothetical protein
MIAITAAHMGMLRTEGSFGVIIAYSPEPELAIVPFGERGLLVNRVGDATRGGFACRNPTGAAAGAVRD